MGKLSAEQQSKIDAIVESYKARFDIAERLSKNLVTLFASDRLAPLVHSMKARAKDPEHLRDKLARKMARCIEAGDSFPVTAENLFETINDLAGVRLLHLHTSQFEKINQILLELLADENYKVLEGPVARTWDDEYKAFFERIGIKTTPSERMYTSVHYVVEPGARTKRTAEIQVRTLAEELWGEVDHAINYPHPCEILACAEQIKVLARVTSSCTRLVDSIFLARESGSEKK